MDYFEFRIDYRLVIMVIALACAYLILCNRVRIVARDMGLSPAKWFFLSVILTPIPAVVVFWRHHLLGLRDRQRGRFRHFFASGRPIHEDKINESAVRRCPHCGEIIVSHELRQDDGVSACPRCGLTIDEDEIA